MDWITYQETFGERIQQRMSELLRSNPAPTLEDLQKAASQAESEIHAS